MYSKVTKGLLVGLIIYTFFILCGGAQLIFGPVNYFVAVSTVIFAAGIVGILCGKEAAPHEAIKAGAISGGAIGIFGLFTQINGQIISVRQYGFGLLFPLGKYNDLPSLLTGVGIIILVWLLITIVLIVSGAGAGAFLAKINSINTQKFNNSNTSTVSEHSWRTWIFIIGLSLLTIAISIVFNSWLISIGHYPNGRLLTSNQEGPWSFCVEESMYRWMDCTIGVKLVMVNEAPVDYSQVENFYLGRYGQIGETKSNESGLQITYGPEPHLWEKNLGPIEMDLGVEKPQFSPNMTPFYVTEEYSVYFRVKN